MTETWYETVFSARIKPVQVEKSTDISVWVQEMNFSGTITKASRRARVSGWNCYFPSWDEAKKHLIERAEAKVDRLRRELNQANGELGNIKGLKKPEGAK